MGPLDAAAGVAGAGAERDLDLYRKCRAGGGARDRPEAASAWITGGFRVDVADDLADKGKHILESTNGGGDNVQQEEHSPSASSGNEVGRRP